MRTEVVSVQNRESIKNDISITHGAHLLDHVSEIDGLSSANGGGPMILHKLIEGVKLHHPQKVLPSSVSQNLEMLNTTTESGKL